MNTKAVRIYGVKDLRLEEFELPTMKDDEIEARIVTDSLCMSTYKVSNQGEKHKKLPNDLKNHPVIMGHEVCGEIVAKGEGVEGFEIGDVVAVCPLHAKDGTTPATADMAP